MTLPPAGGSIRPFPLESVCMPLHIDPIPTLASEAASPWLTAMPIAFVVAGVALLGVWGLSRLQPALGARFGARELPETSPARRASSNDAELAELGSDLEELAERLAATLDAKAAHLEKLIAEADKRLHALDSAQTPQVEAVGAPAPAPGARLERRPAPSKFVAARDMDPDPVSREIFRLADDGRSPAEIAQKLDEQIGKVQLILALRGG